MQDFMPASRGESLADQVYRQLAAGILEGRYSPGQRVNLRALAQATGVSQTPVREALARLISEGVLRTGNRAIEVPLVDRGNFEEMFRLRLMLEGDLAEQAAGHITADLISEVEDVQEQMEAAMQAMDYKLGLRLNVKFHFTIYRAANQPISLQFVEKLWLLIGPSMNLMYPSLATGRSPRHNSILDAMKSGNAARLRRAVEEDIITAREKILSLLPDSGTSPAKALTEADSAPRRVGRPRKLASS